MAAQTHPVFYSSVAIVGAEEIHPVIGKITRFAEPLGIPYIPITPTFPWLGPLGLLPVPTKWTIQIGTPIAQIIPSTSIITVTFQSNVAVRGGCVTRQRAE